MAKNRSGKRHVTGNIITTPSWFGSHTSMVVDHAEAQASGYDANLPEGQVLCKDDRGYYITLKNRLDNGLADPKRYSRRTK